MFNPKRLLLARHRRRLTARELAEATGLAAMTLSRLENGGNQPDETTVEKLSKALSFPVAFFYADDPETLDTGAVSFRSLSKMSAREKAAAESAGQLGLELSNWIEARFSLPSENLLDLSYETNPDAAARSLRQYWGLGEKPIGSMIGLLETHGVRVFSLSENTASVDAFSLWRDKRPYVFLNNFKSAERSIFDAAHELGHLVLHKHGGREQSKSAEREANMFASAFLMPENDVRSRMPRFVTVDLIIRAKARWRVAAMALAYRLHALNMLSDWQYKSACIELGKRGYRIGEPIGIPRESSIVWKKVLENLWSEKITKNDIAEALQIPLDELEGLVWELVSPSMQRQPRQALRSV